MAKDKGKNIQSHIRARIAYLNNAAALLQSRVSLASETKELASQNVEASTPAVNEEPTTQLHSVPKKPISYVARQYTAQFRAVSQKSQIRLSQPIKRSMCKKCETLLVPGSTSREDIENLSRGKKKPWADVRVVKCEFCGTTKRFPLGNKKSLKLVERRKIQAQKKEEIESKAQT